MPADPNAPPGVTGPFSRYLDAPLEGQLAKEVSPEQRPSGFIGTTGKLAMFGSKLLQGLQKGKMQAYAQREQEKYQKFAIAADRVNKAIDNPDLPTEEKAELQNLLGASFGMATKEQVDELKKFHGKKGSGAGSHVLGMIEHIADKLGGPTPAEHSLGGAKDESGKSAFERLNDKLADLHMGGEKYSNKARVAKLTDDISEAVKPYQANFDFRGAALDPKVSSLMQKLYQVDPNQGKLVSQRLQQGLTPPTSQEINADLERSILKDQPAAAPDRGQPAMQPMPGVIGMEIPADTPMLDKRVGAGPPPVSADQSGVKQFEPFYMGRTLITSPAKEEAWLSLHGGTPREDWVKRVAQGPNGKSETHFRRVWSYPKQAGYIKDALTGEKLDGSVWQPAKTAEVDAATKPEKARWITKRNVKGRDVQIHYDDDGKEIPTSERIDLGPSKVEKPTKGSKPVDPEIEEGRRLMNDTRRDTLAERKRKEGAKALTSKIMKQVYESAKANGTTPDKILDQRINDFSVWYKDDPRLEGNYDDIQEALRKRKSEAIAMGSREALAATHAKSAQDSGAMPAPQTESPQQSAPVQQAPQPQKQAAPAAPATPQQGKKKFTEDQVRQRALSSGKDPDLAIQTARQNGLI